jgi:hydrogenase/urease accessory protein HupE
VAVGTPTVVGAGDTRTTGLYQEVDVVLTLTPPAGADVRSFDLGYDAVVDRVVTHTVVVTVRSDWSSGHVTAPYELGTVTRDTVTGDVRPLHVDLGTGSDLRGFVSMVRLGVQHIEEGTDHQLFLLILLLPAPLLAAGRRWSGPVPARRAVRRIASITLSFTLGHSLTLALGALGVPVPQQAVEALIATSILVAAVHALRPLFPGREALVAGCFGLVHGLAFSATLRELDLSGSRLVLSLLGFNLGIELMQLAVVALVLPPLVLLARAGRYTTLRNAAAGLTGVAAVGWVMARLGWSNPVADLADRLGSVSAPVVVLLWVVALLQLRRSTGSSATAPRGDRPRPASSGPAAARTPATRA